MPVPKKRHSNTRTNRRRATWKVKPVNFSKCPSCGEAIMPHRACAACGTYQGRQVIVIVSKEEKGKSKGKKKEK